MSVSVILPGSGKEFPYSQLCARGYATAQYTSRLDGLLPPFFDVKAQTHATRYMLTLLRHRLTVRQCQRTLKHVEYCTRSLEEKDRRVRMYANVCLRAIGRVCVCVCERVCVCAHVYGVSVCTHICTCFGLYMPRCMSQTTEREAECVSLWKF